MQQAFENHKAATKRLALVHRMYAIPQPLLWRREWDSNPRYLAVNTLSKRAPSATRPSLQRCDSFEFTRTKSQALKRSTPHKRLIAFTTPAVPLIRRAPSAQIEHRAGCK